MNVERERPPLDLSDLFTEEWAWVFHCFWTQVAIIALFTLYSRSNPKHWKLLVEMALL